MMLIPPTITVGRYGAGCRNSEPDHLNPIARCLEQRAFFFAAEAASKAASDAPKRRSVGEASTKAASKAASDAPKRKSVGEASTKAASKAASQAPQRMSAWGRS